MFQELVRLEIKEYEKEAIRRICKDEISSEIIDRILFSPQSVELKSCSSVYDLDVFHDDLPAELIVCNNSLVGSFKGSNVGFAITILNHCLTLECYAIGTGTVPKEIRNEQVQLSKT
jgi:hypothetical protein